MDTAEQNLTQSLDNAKEVVAKSKEQYKKYALSFQWHYGACSRQAHAREGISSTR